MGQKDIRDEATQHSNRRVERRRREEERKEERAKQHTSKGAASQQSHDEADTLHTQESGLHCLVLDSQGVEAIETAAMPPCLSQCSSSNPCTLLAIRELSRRPCFPSFKLESCLVFLAMV